MFFRVMDMRSIILSGLLALFLLLQTGCQTVIVNNNKLEGMTGASLVRPGDPSGVFNSQLPNDDFKIESPMMDALGKKSEMGHHVGYPTVVENPYSPFRIKYHPSYSANRWMVVEGSLAGGRDSHFAKSSQNGAQRKYPIILDTGASVGLFVNDIHILENKLAISPFKRGPHFAKNSEMGTQHHSEDSVESGMCYLPELHIGQLTLVNWPCYYRSQHTELQLLGIPLVKGKAIIAGLEALRRFKYIAFDSVKKEVELSPTETFKPEQPDLWAQYSFSIEEDLGGNVCLLVKIPIAGKDVELQLDTGSGRGLAISQELWDGLPFCGDPILQKDRKMGTRENLAKWGPDEIHKKIRHVKLRKGVDLYPYIGRLVCKHGVIPELEVGSRIVRNARVSVFPDDSPIVDQCSGMLGMQYFQDTVMVLDFERNLMWVKGTSSL
jgi:hypothetical protein